MIGKIISEILGFELASFGTKNPDVFRSGRKRQFWTKNPTRMIVSRFADFLKNLLTRDSHNISKFSSVDLNTGYM